MTMTDFQAKTGSVKKSPKSQNERLMLIMKRRMGEKKVPPCGKDRASGAHVEERLDDLHAREI